MNSIDTQDRNPATDIALIKPYSAKNITEKKLVKKHLQKTFVLNIDASAPLLGVVSRFAYQKGLDLLPPIIPKLVAEGCQITILGSGKKALEISFGRLHKQYPGMVSLNVGYNELLSHNIMAGADMLIMPSRFEPCGLNQLCDLTYGTPPIVSSTGGLADSIQHTSPASIKNNTATGFVLKSVTQATLLNTIREATSLWKDKKAWRKIQKNGMGTYVSWASSATTCLDLYKKVIAQQ